MKAPSSGLRPTFSFQGEKGHRRRLLENPKNGHRVQRWDDQIQMKIEPDLRFAVIKSGPRFGGPTTWAYTVVRIARSEIVKGT